MKKSLWMIAFAVVMGMTIGVAEAAPRRRGGVGTDECSYTPLQDLIRVSREADEIKKLMEQGVQMEDPSIKCGGNLLQLAVRRGNPVIVDLILQQSPKRAKENVSLKGFHIPNAPDTVTMAMFAGYYAPSEQIFQLIANSGADLQEVDANGNTVLWYMEQNPVLIETKTYDDVNRSILMGYSKSIDSLTDTNEKKVEDKKE